MEFTPILPTSQLEELKRIVKSHDEAILKAVTGQFVPNSKEDNKHYKGSDYTEPLC